jgi:hypothetical protein
VGIRPKTKNILIHNKQTIKSEMVDVTGIDRKELLEALWNNAQPAAFYILQNIDPPPFKLESAMKTTHGTYVDYACGRCIKADVFRKEDVIDPRLYDRDHGEGAFQRVVDSLKSE